MGLEFLLGMLKCSEIDCGEGCPILNILGIIEMYDLSRSVVWCMNNILMILLKMGQIVASIPQSHWED